MLQHIFIIDPFESLIPRHDSSLAMMREAIALGDAIYQATHDQISWQNNQLLIKTTQINSELRNTKEEYIFDLINNPDNIRVWIRKDPPVNADYIQACQLLRLSKAPVINNPNSLLYCNEKLFALEYAEFTPVTYIENNIPTIKTIIADLGKVVLKPVNGMGGQGIFIVESDEHNLNAILEGMTNNGTEHIIIQEYLKGAIEGDKRIYLLNGEPIGAVLRTPGADDPRANLARGGGWTKTNITDHERHICETIKPRLIELGLYLVGLDVIGEKLTEINITSPTCLEEIHQLENNNPARKIIEWSRIMD